MDFSAAFTNGYNVGKDIGYNFSGQAAEDRRLNREAARAKLNSMNLQDQLAQQQMQYIQEDREKQEKMQDYEGVTQLAMNTANNPVFKSQFITSVNNMNSKWKYSPWVISDPLDDETKDDNKFQDAVMRSYTVHGKGTNPTDKNNTEDVARITQGMIKMTNPETGETQYAHVGDLLYMFGGNTGTAYMHSVIQAKQIKAQQEQAKAQAELALKQSQIQRDSVQNAKDLHDMKLKETQEQNAQNTSNYILNLHQQNQDKSLSTDSKGHATGIGATPKDSEGSSNPIATLQNSQYQKLLLDFKQSNNLSPQEVGTKLSELQQVAKLEKLHNDQFKEAGDAASMYVTKALKAGNVDLAMQYQTAINSALGVKVDENAINDMNLFSAALTQVNNMTANNGNPSEAFFDAFGAGDKLRNFFTAITGLIDYDQEQIFDALNETKNLQSMLAYDMMGKRITKHGLAQMPTVNEWLTGTANLSVIRSQLEKVKNKAAARIKGGDPATSAWAKEAYEQITQMQQQIDDNIALAKVIVVNGGERGALKKAWDFISSKGTADFGDNVIVPIGSSMPDISKYNGRNIINFKTNEEAGNPNKQVEIYLSSNPNEPLYMSAQDFNKMTKGKYYQFTKDIR